MVRPGVTWSHVLLKRFDTLTGRVMELLTLASRAAYGHIHLCLLNTLHVFSAFGN